MRLIRAQWRWRAAGSTGRLHRHARGRGRRRGRGSDFFVSPSDRQEADDDWWHAATVLPRRGNRYLVAARPPPTASEPWFACTRRARSPNAGFQRVNCPRASLLRTKQHMCVHAHPVRASHGHGSSHYCAPYLIAAHRQLGEGRRHFSWICASESSASISLLGSTPASAWAVPESAWAVPDL